MHLFIRKNRLIEFKPTVKIKKLKILLIEMVKKFQA